MLSCHPCADLAIDELQRSYLESLTAPLDGMWMVFIQRAQAWRILDGGDTIGYCRVDDGARLLQFHVRHTHRRRAAEAFASAVDETTASSALVGTFEPWLPLCIDHQVGVRTHTHLFTDDGETEPDPGDEPGRLEVVVEQQRPAIEAFTRTCFDEDPGSWLGGYLEGLVRRAELFALRAGGEVLATGELRVSDEQPPHADLGVIVAPHHRRRGLATAVLGQLKRRATAAGLIPICSTTTENLAARTAIARAGFVDRHRMLEITF